MLWDFKEKRRFPRATFSCKIIIHSPLRLLVCKTKNISGGGIRVGLNRKLSRADTLILKLFFGKDRAVQCEGRVAWTVDIMSQAKETPVMFDTGIEFTNISANDREYIKKTVDELLSHGDRFKQSN